VTDVSVYDQSAYQVRFEWGCKGVDELAPVSDFTVIVDVLSFSTCVDVAVSQGAVVLPFGWKDESAEVYARKHEALLAAKRGQGRYSLSPHSLADLPADTRIVLPSPNGSALTLAAADHADTLAGCLRNRESIANHINRQGGTVAVIACGERWVSDDSLRPALEDQIGAGGIISKLRGSKSSEARAAEALFRSIEDTLCDTVRSCSSGKELIEKGYAEDVECASQLDVSQSVPQLLGNAYINKKGSH
jgi:2-phosphosulfolactate phosphatase